MKTHDTDAQPREAVPRIVRLDDIRDEPVGGKAEGLARLIASGLRVPDGFVILDASEDALPDNLAEHERALGSGALAVRSSALGEDGEDASFAGQYETVLGVEGLEALKRAIADCVASLSSERARAYQATRPASVDDTEARTAPRMCVVVQKLVDARAAGVLFTADPVSNRRGHCVIDAVPGLGEALVSGEASPDHALVARDGTTLERNLAGAAPVLTDRDRRRLIDDALSAEAFFGAPLDLEWAMDASGLIYWLQARPITTLEADPNELDTPLFAREDVYTRCNIGEMFPGACTPLSYSFTARSIDVGMQMMHGVIGIQREVRPHMRFLAMFHGHLFLNLTAMSDTATQALGSSAEQLALSLCGRPLTEVKIYATPPPRWPQRIANGARYGRYLFSRGRARRAMRLLVDTLDFPRFHEHATARAQWDVIDERLDAINMAMHHHLVSSAVSGVLTPTLLGVVSEGRIPSDRDHARVAALLGGSAGRDVTDGAIASSEVESADIALGAERVQRAILGETDAGERFIDASPEDALAWLRDPCAGGAHAAFADYLARHGHRAIKELELRQREWRSDPLPVVRSLQVALRGWRATDGAAQQRPDSVSAEETSPFVRRLTGWARTAVAAREETKSGLVAVTTAFKRVYRDLADTLVTEGRLPDADALFFLTHEELGRCASGEPGLGALAVARRKIFDTQARLRFPDVFVGCPEPLGPPPLSHNGVKRVRGAPVSRGRVSGRVRIVRDLSEAEALRPGEILIAPITDVGWTPYFSLIAGLVTDVGSAVSHGAVVAREYGLPAVVNTQNGTEVFATGDFVVLDGDLGVVELAEPETTPEAETILRESDEHRA